jgi:hypothetical protein
MILPDNVLQIVEDKAKNISHGSVSLKILIHDRKFRFLISEEISIVPDKKMSGSIPLEDSGIEIFKNRSKNASKMEVSYE